MLLASNCLVVMFFFMMGHSVQASTFVDQSVDWGSGITTTLGRSSTFQEFTPAQPTLAAVAFQFSVETYHGFAVATNTDISICRGSFSAWNVCDTVYVAPNIFPTRLASSSNYFYVFQFPSVTAVTPGQKYFIVWHNLGSDPGPGKRNGDGLANHNSGGWNSGGTDFVSSNYDFGFMTFASYLPPTPDPNTVVVIEPPGATSTIVYIVNERGEGLSVYSPETPDPPYYKLPVNATTTAALIYSLDREVATSSYWIELWSGYDALFSGQTFVSSSTIANLDPAAIGRFFKDIYIGPDALYLEFRLMNSSSTIPRATDKMLINSPLSGLHRPTEAELCAGLATSTISGGIECGFKKIIVWAFYPSDSSISTFKDAFSDFKKVFPFAAFFQLTTAVDEAVRANESTTTPAIVYFPMIEKTATGTTWTLLPTADSSTLPSMVGSENAVRIKTTITRTLWVATAVVSIFMLL